MVEMNLHSAGIPLKNLIEKVENTLLAPPEEEEYQDKASSNRSKKGTKGTFKRRHHSMKDRMESKGFKVDGGVNQVKVDLAGQIDEERCSTYSTQFDEENYK